MTLSGHPTSLSLGCCSAKQGPDPAPEGALGVQARLAGPLFPSTSVQITRARGWGELGEGLGNSGPLEVPKLGEQRGHSV